MFVRTVTEIKIINYFILHIIFETTSYAKKMLKEKNMIHIVVLENLKLIKLVF